MFDPKEEEEEESIFRVGEERFIPSCRAAEKRYDEYDGSRDARGKAQEYWAGKLQWFTQRNNNVRMADPMAHYPSHAKERPEKKRTSQNIRRGIAEAAKVS